MLKRHPNAFLMAVAISLAVALIYVSWSGPPYPNQDPPGEQRGGSAENNQQHPPPAAIEIKCDPNCSYSRTQNHGDQTRLSRMIDKTVEDPVAVGTFFLGAVTLILVVVVTCQVRDARKSSQRELRAYLHVYWPEAQTLQIIPDGLMQSQMIIKNSGRTPAYKAVVFAHFKVANFPLTEPLIIDRDQRISPLVIHPREDYEFTVHERNVVSGTDFQIMQSSGTRRLYLFGRIEYVDAFGICRFTDFRLMTPPPGTPGRYSFMVCEKGNDAN